MKRTTRALTLDTLTLEGSLFVADLLEKSARGDGPKQAPADYHLARGLRPTDEASRAFQIACAVWKTHGSTVGKSLAFATEFFRDALGYADFKKASPVSVADRTYPVTAFLTETVPLIVASSEVGLDQPDTKFAVDGSGYKKKSAFALAQEFLNASAPCVWALVTNGKTLRLLRDSASLSRPSYLEFDLDAILDQERYPDFCALWRILHVSRAPREGDTGIWEHWREVGNETGERVRLGLSKAVKQALRDLGSGFLEFDSVDAKGNNALREALTEGTLTRDEYFRELLRLIYRFLFLITIEERGLLGASEAYERGYSLARLRDRSLRSGNDDRYADQWEGIKVVFNGLETGQANLRLPALGGLFASDQCAYLDACQLPNRALLACMKHLRWASMGGSRSLVDYKNMGPEELGSVYESLLELVPVIDLASRRFSFINDHGDDGSDAGNARKTSGSYYTPDSLVQELIKSALDPVIEARLAEKGTDPAEAILSMKVLDPACGSGHFLLASARRLAERLASVTSPDGGVVAGDYRHALRQVIGTCLYGVDRNPMAVELARMALWLEGYEPGKPLGFLDHHLQIGDSLLGLMDLGVLWKGIPGDAFKALSGDDKDVCKALADENKAGTKRIAPTPDYSYAHELLSDPSLSSFGKLETMVDDDLESVGAKQKAWLNSRKAVHGHRLSIACDLYVGAFLASKAERGALTVTPTSMHLASYLTKGPVNEAVQVRLNHARQLCDKAFVFHWPLRFAPVFAQGGFDVILGNPPWEVSQMGEEEFFASRSPRIAELPGETRKKEIANLKNDDPTLYAEYINAKHRYEVANTFFRESSRFPLTAIGKLNSYALFAEAIMQLIRRNGRAGFIVPSGIVGDDSTKAWFSHVATTGNLVSVFDFENRERLFPAVDSQLKFCLVTLGRETNAQFAFFATNASQITDSRRLFSLKPSDLELLNPNTRTCPVFRSNHDALLTKGIYKRVPVLIRDGDEPENPWGIAFSQGLFNMTSDSRLFSKAPKPGDLPLYEAKMIHQFDTRWATYQKGTGEDGSREMTDTEKGDHRKVATPRYWVDEREVLARITKVPDRIVRAWLTRNEVDLRRELELGDLDDELRDLLTKSDIWGGIDRVVEARSPKWLMGWRDITKVVNERTVIATVFPRAGAGDTLLLMFPSGQPVNRYACLLGDQNSLVHDYVARQKVGGTHLKYHVKKQLPNLLPSAYSLTELLFIVPRIMELTFNTHDLAPWAEDVWNSLDSNGRVGLLIARHEASENKDPYCGPTAEETESLVWAPELVPPFPWNPDRRARLRAELDARYARLYGLTREELCYILDPASVMGDDYPSETFRVLKNNEIRDFGEYRTQRLVLEAWDANEAPLQ